MSDTYYDERETRDPEAREAALMAALSEQIAHTQAKAPAFAETLAGVDAATVTSRAALAELPVVRKSEVAERQQKESPFGGLAAVAPGAAARIFASPGPIYELQAARKDYWRCARALHAAGFRCGDVVHNAFSYHLTPGGWILDAGLRALGCAVVPAGVGNTEAQAQTIAQLRPVGYTGTPDFLKVLLDQSTKLGFGNGRIKRGLVSGGALFPSLRQDYAERGIAVLQCYATAELGLIAYETRPDGGLIVDEDLIVEIVRPGTGDPVPEGEVGEVVVTTLAPEYPLIRFATGDLSAVLPGASGCGRTNMRLKGWLGRADQTAKLKGMFVHPSQIAAVMKRHPEIARARLVISRAGEQDRAVLKCEIGEAAPNTDAIAETFHALCKVRAAVERCAPGDLPNDGKVIEDTRTYD